LRINARSVETNINFRILAEVKRENLRQFLKDALCSKGSEIPIQLTYRDGDAALCAAWRQAVIADFDSTHGVLYHR
jgi:hypothetical protein